MSVPGRGKSPCKTAIEEDQSVVERSKKTSEVDKQEALAGIGGFHGDFMVISCSMDVNFSVVVRFSQHKLFRLDVWLSCTWIFRIIHKTIEARGQQLGRT